MTKLIYICDSKTNNVMKTLAENIGTVAGFAVNQLPDGTQVTAEDIAIAVENGIANPPEGPEAIASAGDILKAATPGKEHVHKIIDAAVDLAVHEDGEGAFEDAGTLLKVVDDAIKAWRDERKSDRKERKEDN